MAATLVLRTVKGTPLTNLEVDNNFSNISTYANTIDANIGLLASLTTTSTSNIVFAVNSIKNGNLSQFGSTTSADLATLISDETGTGNVVFSISPTLVTPNVGTPSYINLTNATGTASNLTANIANFINVTDDTSSNVTVYPIFANNTSGAITEQVSSTKLTFNPSTGLLTSTDYNSSSDMTLKQDFTPIQNPLDIISQLTGFGFTWKDSKQKAYGLSAQEVEKVIPDIVRDRPDGTKGINYMNLTAFLIEAIKDLKQEVTELKKHK